MSATNRGSVRRIFDRYQTPLLTIETIFPYIAWRRVRTFGEPCKGTGNILTVLDTYSAQQEFSCFVNWCEIAEGLDYFQSTWKGLDLILTNPPFNQAHKFLELSLQQAKTVVYLMRLNILGSGGGSRARPETRARSLFLQANPPSHLFALSERPSFRSTGSTDSTEYAWFAWDRGNFILKRPGIYIL
jgi:hypothetical protein